MPLTDEQKKQQKEAREELEAIFAASRPKNLRQGLTHGVGNVLGGCVGAAGIIVLAPTAGLAAGTKQAGLVGGLVGLTGGAIVGALGGAAMAVGGAVSGAGQILRGVAAIPAALTAPSQGKWWNDNEGRWVYTDLPKELEKVPNDDDSDILGDLEAEVEGSVRLDAAATTDVKDTHYYDILNVDPNADASAIKRKYYVLARQYHPDKAGHDNKEAANKFKDIAEAYQVLSDADLRAKYDSDGREGLSADKTSVADDVAKLDPALLFAFLFGSDKFDDYVGRLAMATSALVGDSPKVSKAQARTIQKRRVTRLAGHLATQLDAEGSQGMWMAKVTELSKASYGLEMVHTIGKVYELAAVYFIGSMENGLGLPAVKDGAKSIQAKIKKNQDMNKKKYEQLKAGLNGAMASAKLAQELEKATTEEAKQEVYNKMEKEKASTLLQVMWTTTVVDITSTLWEVVQMVLFDQSVDKDTRKKRAHGLKALGKIFADCPPPPKSNDEVKDAQKLYEEAAFAAMLETVQRKDEAAFDKEHMFNQ